MTGNLDRKLSELEAAIRLASFVPVPQIPFRLSGAVAMLREIQSAARNCPSQDRPDLSQRLSTLRLNLSIFSSAMERSAMIFDGYCRRAGLSANGYTAGGEFLSDRDPALLDLRV